MKRLETRTAPNGLRRRRYRDGSRVFTTYEPPAAVVRSVGMDKIVKLLAVHRAGLKARALAAERRAFIAERLDWKSTALAHELKITEARVRQIKKAINGG